MPQNIRPSNINRAKVPTPGYRPAMTQPVRPSKTQIVEEVALAGESRGISLVSGIPVFRNFYRFSAFYRVSFDRGTNENSYQK